MGYWVYLVKHEVFQIKEMVDLNQAAHKGLWQYVSVHESMINEVAGNNSYNHIIAVMLEDSAIKVTIRPYIMAQVVGFKAFLRRYQFSNHDDTMSFVIRNPVLEWNIGPFTEPSRKDGAPG